MTVEQSIVNQYEKSKDFYCGILRNNKIKVDIKRIIDHCWIVWSNEMANDINDYIEIFKIILQSNNVRLTYFTAFENIDYLPYLSITNKDKFLYVDENHYLDNLHESCFMEKINSNLTEMQFKNIFENYFTWLGYEQK